MASMKKREPGFLGLAKQNAKRKGNYAKKNNPEKVTADKRGMVDSDHGFGLLTNTEKSALNYLKNKDKAEGYPSGNGPTLKKLAAKNKHPFDYVEYKGMKVPSLNDFGRDEGDESTGGRADRGGMTSPEESKSQNDRNSSSLASNMITGQKKEDKFKIGYDNKKSLWENIKSIDIPGWIEQEWNKLDFSGKPQGELTDKEKMQAIQNNPDAQQQVMGNLGGPQAAAAAAASAKEEAYEKDRQEDYEKGQDLSRRRDAATIGRMKDASGKFEGEAGYDASSAKRDITDSYEGYKQQAKGLGAESKELTKGFGEDVEKLGGYQSKFDTMAGEAKTRGDTAETEYGGAAETGAGKLEGVGEDARDTFDAGAEDVGAVKKQFGKEGFQKDIRGMSEAALDSDLGQRDAELLKGRMEEQRMASTKGSEEKLRRELAASGADPAEIAAKVAQFQSKQATSQAQAGRSESLQANIQGRQMGQQSLSQAAQLKGQEAGMAGKQAGLAVQQAQLKGQGLAMEGQMAQAGAGMRMKGIEGGAQLGFQGAAQQGQMLGQGMGAVQAAGTARQQQMGGLDQQGQFIDQEAGFTQSQLADTVAQETQAYQEEQARLTRSAQGTPDDPRWRPPTAGAPPVTGPDGTPVAADGSLPPGTTTAQPPPQNQWNPAQAPGIAQAGGMMAQQTPMGQGQGGGMDNAQGQHSQMKASLNAQRQSMNPQQLQESQAWEKNYDAFHNAGGGRAGMAAVQQGQQGGLMGQPGMRQQGLRSQGGAVQGQDPQSQQVAAEQFRKKRAAQMQGFDQIKQTA